MRILFVLTNDGFGGGEFYVRDMALALMGAGHDVHVFIAGSGAPLHDELTLRGVPASRSGVPLRVSRGHLVLRNGFALRSLAGKWRPDVVVDNLPRSVVISSLFLPRSRHVSLLHGPLRADPISRVAARLVRRLLTNTETTRSSVLLSVGRDIPSEVVHPTAFPPLPAPDVHRTLITMIGRWQPYKGHSDFVRVASILRDRSPELRFCIIGSIADAAQQTHYAEVMSQVRNLGLSDRFEVLVGASNAEVQNRLRRTAVYAHLAQSEDFGISILEALLSGCAVVAYAAEGPKNILREHPAAKLISIGDSAAFASAVAGFLDVEDTAALSANAIELAAKYAFGPDYIAAADSAIRRLATDVPADD